MARITGLSCLQRSANGALQTLELAADSALVGSAAHCDIRLPSEDVAPEQLLVQTDGNSVFAAIRSAEPPVWLGASVFTQGYLPTGSCLRLGGIELELVPLQNVAGGSQSGFETSSKLPRCALGGLALLVLTVALAGRGGADSDVAAVVEPPPLWSPITPPVCAERDQVAANASAESQRKRAEASRERSAFSPRDGVAAVTWFEGSAACFQTAGNSNQARQQGEAARQLQRMLNASFHLHGVRLERALKAQQREQTRTEIATLLSFVEGHGGEYAQWLVTLDRQFQLELSNREKK